MKTNEDVAQEILKVIAAFTTISKMYGFPIEIDTNSIVYNLKAIIEKANFYDEFVNNE